MTGPAPRPWIIFPTRSYEKAPEDRELAQGGPFARAVERLAAALPPVQVVVHRALWATVSVTGEPLPKPAAAERMNGWLSKAYDLLASTLPNVTVVTPDPGVTVADPGHRWGLAPFHYVPAYYDEGQLCLRAEKAREEACREVERLAAH